MERFDRSSFLSKIYQEFKRTDEFYMEFRSVFRVNMLNIVNNYYPNMISSNELASDLKLYADELISAAETTLYKDANYPERRMEEETAAMGIGASNIQLPGLTPEFMRAVLRASKKQVVDYFPGIFDLTASGFLLLDFYMKLYHTEFATTFYRNHLNEE